VNDTPLGDKMGCGAFIQDVIGLAHCNVCISFGHSKNALSSVPDGYTTKITIEGYEESFFAQFLKWQKKVSRRDKKIKKLFKGANNATENG
jgi:hypothetical protein